MDNIKDIEGIRIGGRNINNIRLADDTALIAGSPGKLQTLLDIVARESEDAGLKINTRTTYCLVATRETDSRPYKIYLKGDKVEQVHTYKYLGVSFTNDGRSKQEIRKRIGMAKTAFNDLAKILTNKHISLATSAREYVFNVFF